MKVLKRIGAIFVDFILVLLLFISAFSVISSINEKKTGFGSCLGIGAMEVVSDSMSGTFEKGDLIFSKKFDPEKDTIEVGQVITFQTVINGELSLNTHRVSRIVNDKIFTKGDNNATEDASWITVQSVKGIYTDVKLKGFGNVISFLKDPIAFVCCIVCPLVVYIIFQVLYIVKIYTKGKKEEMIEEAKAGTSEDVKEAIIKEYLAKQQAEQEKRESKNK